MEPALLTLISCRCGDAELCPAGPAITKVVRAMLRPDQCALPRPLWRAACMHVIRWLQSRIANMQAKSESLEPLEATQADLLKQLQQLQSHGKRFEEPSAAGQAVLGASHSEPDAGAAQPNIQHPAQQLADRQMGRTQISQHYAVRRRHGCAVSAGAVSGAGAVCQGSVASERGGTESACGQLSSGHGIPPAGSSLSIREGAEAQPRQPVAAVVPMLSWSQLPSACLLMCQQMMHEVHQLLAKDIAQVRHISPPQPVKK